MAEERDDDNDDGPPRGPIVMLVVLVALVAVTVFVMHRINQASTMQDCLASGRTNCATITAPGR